MGNSESSEDTLTSDQKISTIIMSPSYLSVKRRVEKMGIEMTFQGDGSIQLQNPKDLVKGNKNIPGPKTIGEAEETLRQVTKTLNEWMSDCGYVHVTYQ